MPSEPDLQKFLAMSTAAALTATTTTTSSAHQSYGELPKEVVYDREGVLRMHMTKLKPSMPPPPPQQVVHHLYEVDKEGKFAKRQKSQKSVKPDKLNSDPVKRHPEACEPLELDLWPCVPSGEPLAMKPLHHPEGSLSQIFKSPQSEASHSLKHRTRKSDPSPSYAHPKEQDLIRKLQQKHRTPEASLLTDESIARESEKENVLLQQPHNHSTTTGAEASSDLSEDFPPASSPVPYHRTSSQSQQPGAARRALRYSAVEEEQRRVQEQLQQLSSSSSAMEDKVSARAAHGHHPRHHHHHRSHSASPATAPVASQSRQAQEERSQPTRSGSSSNIPQSLDSSIVSGPQKMRSRSHAGAGRTPLSLLAGPSPCSSSVKRGKAEELQESALEAHDSFTRRQSILSPTVADLCGSANMEWSDCCSSCSSALARKIEEFDRRQRRLHRRLSRTQHQIEQYLSPTSATTGATERSPSVAQQLLVSPSLV